MSKISQERINAILERHKHWLNEDCTGWENMRANLHGVDLHGADLHGVDLYGADLNHADLRGATLHGSDFRRADLRGANLTYSDLTYVNLAYANLKDTILFGTNLYKANLNGAENVPYIPMVCPEEGGFVGWKKAKIIEKYSFRQVIVKLSISEDAKRLSSTTRKCRCNKANVLEIYNLDGTVAQERICHSIHDHKFTYEVGKTVEVDDFDENRWIECSRGIHFFMNRQEAIDY